VKERERSAEVRTTSSTFQAPKTNRAKRLIAIIVKSKVEEQKMLNTNATGFDRVRHSTKSGTLGWSTGEGERARKNPGLGWGKSLRERRKITKERSSNTIVKGPTAQEKNVTYNLQERRESPKVTKLWAKRRKKH